MRNLLEVFTHLDLAQISVLDDMDLFPSLHVEPLENPSQHPAEITAGM